MCDCRSLNHKTCFETKNKRYIAYHVSLYHRQLFCTSQTAEWCLINPFVFMLCIINHIILQRKLLLSSMLLLSFPKMCQIQWIIMPPSYARYNFKIIEFNLMNDPRHTDNSKWQNWFSIIYSFDVFFSPDILFWCVIDFWNLMTKPD